MRNQNTNRIVMIAMFVSLVMAATYIGFPTPASMGGYVHLGTIVMLAVAMRYGKYYGALAGGIGMAMFDVFSPWIAWAPGTFVIRLAMGFVVGLIAYDPEKGQGGSFVRNIIAFFAAMLIMMPGYFVYQAWMLSSVNGGGYKEAIAGIPGNATQFLLGVVSLWLVRYLPTKKELNL